jgi:hypothetical protein
VSKNSHLRMLGGHSFCGDKGVIKLTSSLR